MNKRILFIIATLFFIENSTLIFSSVRLPAIIGSHMVLQQKSEVNFWGWANPGEKIILKAGWDTTSYSTVGSRGAKWIIKIKTPSAGGSYTIMINGQNEIKLEDVLIGEVWICSGQSNMEWSGDQGVKQSIEEAPNSFNTNIRLFYIPKTTSDYLQENCDGTWKVCNAESMIHFSSIGYFYGKQLQKELNIPIGLINDNWGGTSAEVWTPAELVIEDPALSRAAAELDPSYPYWPILPGETFNAMVNPITKYNIAGVIWYQGESNARTYDTYGPLFKKMIGAWRKAWGKDFPFYYVQIAPYTYGQNNIGALLREVQTSCLDYPNTGMVVISDLVDDTTNIHPQNKKDVAARLTNLALSETYHKTGLAYKSSMFKSMKIEKNKIRIVFNNADNGLISRGGDPKEFYIAGDDKNFLPAIVKIEGNTVLVYNKKIKSPVAVRFGFSNTSIPNLFSREGLPVNLFHTDEWPVNTDKVR